MKVEVAYATPEAQHIISLELSEGATLFQAIQASQILMRCPEIDLQQQKVGIWGIIADHDTVLKENNRVEIYRSLPMDPIIKRFERIKKERKKWS